MEINDVQGHMLHISKRTERENTRKGNKTNHTSKTFERDRHFSLQHK